MAQLLLVDDDRFVLQGLQKLLSAEGFACRAVTQATEARRLLDAPPPAEAFDLLILDVGLPDQDGFGFCRQIRARHRMPILLLTGRGETTDKVIGLEVGADDYLTKPFEPRELVARVRALLRRAAEYSAPSAAARQRIDLGELVLDVDGREAYREGVALRLTEREFELLHLLARHRNKALATEWIFESVWGADAEFGLKTLTVYVRRVRQKIERDPSNPRILCTVRGFGYKLVCG